MRLPSALCTSSRRAALSARCTERENPRAAMTPVNPESYAQIRAAVRALCADFPDAYFRELDAARAYPEAFVAALTKAGWLAALIPEEYGGSGLGLTEASVILE